jgi:hypothetical protein
MPYLVAVNWSLPHTVVSLARTSPRSASRGTTWCSCAPRCATSLRRRRRPGGRRGVPRRGRDAGRAHPRAGEHRPGGRAASVRAPGWWPGYPPRGTGIRTRPDPEPVDGHHRQGCTPWPGRCAVRPRRSPSLRSTTARRRSCAMPARRPTIRAEPFHIDFIRCTTRDPRYLSHAGRTFRAWKRPALGRRHVTGFQ